MPNIQIHALDRQLCLASKFTSAKKLREEIIRLIQHLPCFKSAVVSIHRTDTILAKTGKPAPYLHISSSHPEHFGSVIITLEPLEMDIETSDCKFYPDGRWRATD